MNLLFLCSRNQWRSPTAEKLYSRTNGINARSRGVSSSAARRLTAADVRWADVIFAMETEHARRVRREFAAELGERSVHVLDIPDDYRFMDPELVELIEDGVAPYLDAD